MVKGGSRQHQAVEMGHRQADLYILARAQRAAGAGSMSGDRIALAPIERWSHYRIAFENIADMAEHACIEHGIERVPIIGGAFVDALDARSLARW